MSILRLKTFQNKAHFRKKETSKNKMTYPLPPFSTIIGALHKAGGFKEYHEMEISVQGSFQTLYRQQFIDNCFLDTAKNDRNVLVKLANSDLYGKAYNIVGKSMKKSGNDFLENKTIDVFDNDLLLEYQNLKNLNNELKKFKKIRLKPITKRIKARKNKLKEKLNKAEKNSEIYIKIKNRIDEYNSLSKKINREYKKYLKVNYEIPYSKFGTLATGPKNYEILSGLELVIHVKSDDNTISKLMNNIHNLKAIGRSEDFVQIIDYSLVDVTNVFRKEIMSQFSSYINYKAIKDEVVIIGNQSDGKKKSGTVYYIDKNYEIVNNKRVFNKKKVVYTSNYVIDDESSEYENIYFDGDYIVNFN